jgi:HD superfamily phosphohydrolase
MSKVFNDPIYGRISVPDYCLEIIDTPEFQRLRYLKQLGLVNYVFYGATHTRFEHSIGVCYLSGKWVKHLQKRHPEFGITDKDIKIIQLSGLVHDIAHGPFSHTFERFIRLSGNSNYHHEEMSIKIFKYVANKLGLETDIIESVCNIILGKHSDNEKYLGHKAFLGNIVNNTLNGLDADKLDYFTRDSQCTSFKIGCDWKRIVYESSVHNSISKSSYEIVFPQKLVGDIFNLYQTRFRLYNEVYYHKTVRVIEHILLETLLLADTRGIFKFIDSKGQEVSLAESVNDVESFIMTQDDIIGQMERCGIPEIVNEINKIKTRNFKDIDTNDCVSVEAHYGMHDKNPLKFVKFVDKNGNVVNIDQNIIDSMCPQYFSIIK